MAFPESFLQELAERNDIVDVVSSYVRLTKKSGSNLFGLCPFHSEKTPSFSVSPDKQIYHCFGCGKGGSVISFIMEIENLSFPEAVAFLANRAGMQLPEQSDDPGAKKRQRLLALNRDAARFFHAQLKTPAGQIARDYLARRQLTAQTPRGAACPPSRVPSTTVWAISFACTKKPKHKDPPLSGVGKRRIFSALTRRVPRARAR